MLFNKNVTYFVNGKPEVKNNRILFLHIPKTGGTSIEYCLEREIGKGNQRHNNIRVIEDFINGQDINEYKIFTVIRNPLDRIISTWRWWVFHKDGYIIRPFFKHKYGNEKIPYTSFKDYVLMIKDYFDGNADVSDNSISIKKDKAPLDRRHIEKLDWWLIKHDTSLIKCDFLKFENLNKEWQKYKKKLKIRGQLKHKNGSLTIPFTKCRDELYDEETYRILSKIYKDEIRRVGYEKG